MKLKRIHIVDALIVIGLFLYAALIVYAEILARNT